MMKKRVSAFQPIKVTRAPSSKAVKRAGGCGCGRTIRKK
ncbi:hypothetical protein B4168_2914 [Anoxybacillus flavithermus]|uniref:Uncharacterized protein n=1 Tax=Geobacillus sp. (strain Y4.1MC1) TaxID=581103 RepID=A0A7U3YH86_GEOS0|nr:hypothetical protein B4168_2914 [Anoxybacillus flavithermus]OAO86203.1 hypothetical protein GT23_2096 [Parageobacillus thermoglucosidasius]